MAVLDVGKVSKLIGHIVIFEDISFKLSAGEKVGLIGENGCGKTTLLKMIADLEEVSSGTIAKPRDLRIAYLEQEPHFREGNTFLEEILSVFSRIDEIELQLRECEQAMSNAEDDYTLEYLMKRYSRLTEEYEHYDGYSYRAKTEAMLDKLNIPESLRRQKIENLSNGEESIVGLVKVLLQEPDLLLLDEPGNHLDFEALDWLEDFLSSSDKTILIVSHNRYMLDRVVSRILEIEDRQLHEYPGNYSSYQKQKLERLLAEKKQFELQQKEIEKLENMIRRLEVWGDFVKARSKEKMLAKIERIDKPVINRKTINLTFDQAERSGTIVLDIQKYSKSFGDLALFRDADLYVTNSERVGLIGSNGTGKTTLLKDIVREADWANPGFRVGPRVKLGYYSQEHSTLDPEATVFEEMMKVGFQTKAQAITILAKFLFKWEELDKRVKVLSGGEKSRLQLAKLVSTDTNFLLLDEPTNHLDIKSRDKIEEALEAFEGTILTVSHDRYFLDKICNRIVEVKDTRLISYDGNFSEYWRSRKAEAVRRDIMTKLNIKEDVTGLRDLRKQKKSKDKPKTFIKRELQEKIKDIESEIERLDNQRLSLERQADESLRKGYAKKSRTYLMEMRKVETRLEELYSKWEGVLEEMEQKKD